MEMSCYKAPDRMAYLLNGEIGESEVQYANKRIMELVFEKVAAAIAERFLADRLQETLALLNPEAVANLAVADAAGAIRESLHKKLPDKIVEVVRTQREVYQRGVFGGMKRIG